MEENFVNGFEKKAFLGALFSKAKKMFASGSKSPLAKAKPVVSGMPTARMPSPGNIQAMQDVAKRSSPRKPPGSVDLGQYWKEPLNTKPRWKETLPQRA